MCSQVEKGLVTPLSSVGIAALCPCVKYLQNKPKRVPFIENVKRSIFLHRSALQPRAIEVRFNSCFVSLLKFPLQGAEAQNTPTGNLFYSTGMSEALQDMNTMTKLCHLPHNLSKTCSAIILHCLIGRPWLFI